MGHFLSGHMSLFVGSEFHLQRLGFRRGWELFEGARVDKEKIGASSGLCEDLHPAELKDCRRQIESHIFEKNCV